MSARSLLSIAFVLLFLGTHAQDKKHFAAPDYAGVEKASKDKAGKYYYPKLLKRFQSNDTLLTAQQMHMLYYGSFFNESQGASAFSKLNYIDSIKAIHEKDSLSQTDRKKLIRYYLTDLKDNPYSLRTLNALLNLSAEGNDPKAPYYLFKLRSVANTILGTGDGMSAETGFHVNSVSDEYALLGMLGFEDNGTPELVGSCDFLPLKPNKFELPGMYFNVAQMMKAYNKAHVPQQPGKKK